MHYLRDFDVADYPTVDDYLQAVMLPFFGYKKLDKRGMIHYWRKTARYYFDCKNTSGPSDKLRLPAKQRLVIRRGDSREKIGGYLAKLSSKHDVDLRRLDGYDKSSKRFLFPSHVVEAIKAGFAKDQTVSTSTAAMMFLVLALVTPPEAAAEVQRHLQYVQKASLHDALANAETVFKDGFDVAAIKRQIIRVFGM